MSNTQNSDLNVGREDVLNMLSAVRSLLDETAQLYNQYDNQPAANSTASQEQKSFPNEELIIDVHSRGLLSMESAADHLMVFVDSITEPAKTVAPWTCVRGLLESSALAVWFFDPMVDAKVRVGRCFAFRYDGFTEQVKFFRVQGMLAHIGKVQQRIEKVEQDALALGYTRILNKKGEVFGIAQRMPSIVEIIGQTLNKEAEYRLLSAVAHGHHWAIHQIGFQVIETERSKNGIEKSLVKHLHPISILYLANIAVMVFAKVLWYLWRLYGWNLEEIERLLDRIYDQLKYRREIRFWCSS
jgi:hypothetical protein